MNSIDVYYLFSVAKCNFWIVLLFRIYDWWKYYCINGFQYDFCRHGLHYEIAIAQIKVLQLAESECDSKVFQRVIETGISQIQSTYTNYVR